MPDRDKGPIPQELPRQNTWLRRNNAKGDLA